VAPPGAVPAALGAGAGGWAAFAALMRARVAFAFAVRASLSAGVGLRGAFLGFRPKSVRRWLVAPRWLTTAASTPSTYEIVSGSAASRALIASDEAWWAWSAVV
jgi:hypothetical protein